MTRKNVRSLKKLEREEKQKAVSEIATCDADASLAISSLDKRGLVTTCTPAMPPVVGEEGPFRCVAGTRRSRRNPRKGRGETGTSEDE